MGEAVVHVKSHLPVSGTYPILLLTQWIRPFALSLQYTSSTLRIGSHFSRFAPSPRYNTISLRLLHSLFTFTSFFIFFIFFFYFYFLFLKFRYNVLCLVCFTFNISVKYFTKIDNDFYFPYLVARSLIHLVGS